MTSAVTQIKSAYEQGMTPAEIAEDQCLELGAVKAALMQSSKVYRKECGMEDEEVSDGKNFDDDQLRVVNKVIFETAIAATLPDGSIDWRCRLDAAKYVRDDKKGRKEVVKQVQGNVFNILQLNEQFKESREAANRAKMKYLKVA